jgi:type IV pilus assembly protein PilF
MRPIMRQSLLVLLSAMLVAGCTTTGNAQVSGDSRPVPADPLSRARIHTELAALYFQQGSMKTALEELGNAVRIDPQYAPAYSMYGLVFMQLGERTQANDSFQKAITLAPNDPDIRNNYGLFLCESQQYAAGLAQLNLALANPLYGTPARALVTAARCAHDMGNDTLAANYRQRASALGVTTTFDATSSTRQTLQ